MRNSLFFKLFPLTLFLFLALFSLDGIAQNKTALRYGVQSNLFFNTSDSAYLPFWLYANNDGKVLEEGNAFQNSYFATYKVDNPDSRFRYELGVDAVSRLSDVSRNNAFFFSELYGSVGYGFLNLNVGRFHDPIGLNEHDLSSGAMMMSRNATPFPKIQIETEGFIDIPYTQGYAEFKGMFSNGWLEENRYISSPLFHQKYLYLKLNYKNFEAYGGAIHQVMWGGVDPVRGMLPSSVTDFFRVVFGQAASSQSGAPGEEIVNVLGNSIAGYEFRLNVNLSSLQLFAHRLFFLEDKVSTRFRSPWDGMWSMGMNMDDKNHLVNSFIWEHINTKQQDSKLHENEPRGSQTYYNHGLYRGGWSYENRMLGNPLFIFGSNPNFVSEQAISNNIIIAHHFGIQGKPIDRLSYGAFFTYSRNYGEFNDVTMTDPSVPLSELRIDQYSTLLRLKYLVSEKENISLIGSFALDSGGLYRDRVGYQLGFRWEMSQGLK